MTTSTIEASIFRESGEILYLFITVIVVLLASAYFVGLSPWVTIGLGLLGFLYIKLQQAQLIGNALEVNGFQTPEIFEIFSSHKKALNLKNVGLYIRQDPTPNAFTIGFPRASIILSSSLVEGLNLEELSFVIAHELGHVKASHNVVLTFINPLGNGFFASNLIFSFWQRKAEYSCDKCGLILTKALEPAVSTLLKVSIGPSLAKKIDMAAYREQLVNSGNNMVRASELLFDHPLTTNRINKMVLFWKDSFIRR